MTKLTVSQAAEKSNLSIPQLNYLIRHGYIKAEKLDPAKRTSPYVISERELEAYEKAPKKPGMPAKRCEPCRHTLKKDCSACKRLICIKDYRKEKTGLPAARCKDCELAAKRAARKK